MLQLVRRVTRTARLRSPPAWSSPTAPTWWIGWAGVTGAARSILEAPTGV